MSEQPEETTPQGRINYGGEGIGAVTPELLEERARQLAKIDGRTAVNDVDRATAQDELLGRGEPVAPETTDALTEELTAWDESPDATGIRAPRVVPEDEASIGETLVDEGLEEADHDQRLNAAEENPPEDL